VVQAGFRNLSTQLRLHAPEVAAEIEKLRVSQTERAAFAHALHLLSDPRVRDFGLEVGRALRDSASSDRQYLRRRVEERLGPRLPELRRLREEVVSEALESLWGTGRQWELTLDPENVRSMETVSGQFVFEYEGRRIKNAVSPAQKFFALAGGSFEEGRTLLDLMQLCIHSIEPHWTTTFSKTVTFDAAPLTWPCELTSSEYHDIDFMKALMCPLKFGAMGLDALRAAYSFQSEHTQSEPRTEAEYSYEREHLQSKPRTTEAPAPASTTTAEPPASSSTAAAQPQPQPHPQAVPDPQQLQHLTTACDAQGLCPLWGLFFHKEMHEAAVDNIMRVGRGLITPDDRAMALDVVRAAFRNISAQLRLHAPTVASELDQVEYSSTELEAMLASVRLISDPRVRDVGLDVSRAIRASPSPERSFLKGRIGEHLRPRREEIRQLRSKVVKGAMGRLWKMGHDWGLTLRPENIKSMETVSHHFAKKFVPVSEDLSFEKKFFAIYGGALEEGNFLLEMLQMCISFFGSSWSFDLHGAMDFAQAPLSWPCELDDPLGISDSNVDYMKALLCPLKFGVQGVDALNADITTQSIMQPESAEGSSPPRRESPPAPSPPKQQPDQSESTTREGRSPRPPADAAAKPHLFPLRSLFKSPEVHEVAAQDLMTVAGARLAPVDLEMATNVVLDSFEKIDEQLRLHAPEVASELSQIELTIDERRGMLSAMRLLSDRRVQDIGLTVARAIRASPYEDWEYLQHHIEAALRPGFKEIQELREELVPSSLRRLWAEGHRWGLTLNPENIRSLRNTSEAFKTRTVKLTPILDVEKKYFALYSGALQEGRTLLDLLQMCIRALGPDWSTSLKGTMQFGTDTLSWPCELNLDDPESNADFMQALLCPLKFGSQGIDALTASSIHHLSG
jgi:hypothetical protein